MGLAEINQVIRQNAYQIDMASIEDWSERIVEVPNAFILPQTRYSAERPEGLIANFGSRIVYNGGVYTAAGALVPEAIHLGGEHRHVPEPWVAPQTPEKLSGTWIFGGVLRGHFGHFIMESLGRLWGLDHVSEPIHGIVYNVMHNRTLDGSRAALLRFQRLASSMTNMRFVRDMFSLLGGDQPIRTIDAPVVVDKLIVPTQLIGNIDTGSFSGGHSAFRDFLHGRFAPLRSPSRKRVYISRSRLAPHKASFLMEGLFEDALALEGYDIIHPQTLSIQEQLSICAESEKIITPTGSAAHLVAFASHSGQDVALIDREFAAPPKFEAQMRRMGARSVTSIDRVVSRLMPASEEEAALHGWKRTNAPHLLDFDRVWQDLSAAGFVSKPVSFSATVRKREAAAISAISEQYGGAPMLKDQSAEKYRTRKRTLRDRQNRRRKLFVGHLDALTSGIETEV